MNHRDMIEACQNLDAASLLERRGARLTNNGARFSPCPSCGGGHSRGRGPCIITPSKKGFQCYVNGSGCGAKGSSLDILLLLEGLDPSHLTEAHYEAMARELGEHIETPRAELPSEPPTKPLFTTAQIQAWYRGMCQGGGDAPVKRWLCDVRGLHWFGSYACGVAILPRQIPAERSDLRRAVEPGPCAAIPLNSTHPDRLGAISNLVIRTIAPSVIDPGTSKPWKAKCLNAGTGSTRDDGWPLVYGDPSKVDASKALIVVEGALDQLTLSAMGFQVIGAFCAGDIPLLARFLRSHPAEMILVPHLDRSTPAHPGGAGQEQTAKLKAVLPGSRLLAWDAVLSGFGITIERYKEMGRTDVNDMIRTDAGPQIGTIEALVRAFRRVV